MLDLVLSFVIMVVIERFSARDSYLRDQRLFAKVDEFQEELTKLDRENTDLQYQIAGLAAALERAESAHQDLRVELELDEPDE